MGSYVWLIVILILSIIEVATCGLTTVWFVISAIVSLILSFFITNDFVLFTVFVVLGAVLLLTTRPILKKYTSTNKVATNIDKIIGLKAVCTIDILPDEVGEVKVEGKYWSAISNDKITEGEKVIVKQIKSVKLVVEREKN